HRPGRAAPGHPEVRGDRRSLRRRLPHPRGPPRGRLPRGSRVLLQRDREGRAPPGRRAAQPVRRSRGLQGGGGGSEGPLPRPARGRARGQSRAGRGAGRRSRGRARARRSAGALPLLSPRPDPRGAGPERREPRLRHVPIRRDPERVRDARLRGRERGAHGRRRARVRGTDRRARAQAPGRGRPPVPGHGGRGLEGRIPDRGHVRGARERRRLVRRPRGLRRLDAPARAQAPGTDALDLRREGPLHALVPRDVREGGRPPREERGRAEAGARPRAPLHAAQGVGGSRHRLRPRSGTVARQRTTGSDLRLTRRSQRIGRMRGEKRPLSTAFVRSIPSCVSRRAAYISPRNSLSRSGSGLRKEDAPMNVRRLFVASCVSLLTTSMVFAIRGDIEADLSAAFHLTKEQMGLIWGPAFLGFALSIIVSGTIVDAIGMRALHVISSLGYIGGVLLVLVAPRPDGPVSSIFGSTGTLLLYVAFLAMGLSQGLVEGVINPLVATIYNEEKTHKLNVLHAWWPGGMIVGGLTALLLTQLGASWQVKLGTILVPAAIYLLMVL